MEGSCTVIVSSFEFKWNSLTYICLWKRSWIKFEEDVEDGGNRWTKPFVGTLSLHALFELRSALLNGTLLLDAEATTVDEVINVIVDKVCSTHQLTAEQKNQVCNPWSFLLQKKERAIITEFCF